MGTPDKEALLQHVTEVSEAYKAAQDAVATLREEFVDAVKDAHDASATQLEIAERTGEPYTEAGPDYSRQRIAQFLKERENVAVATE